VLLAYYRYCSTSSGSTVLELVLASTTVLVRYCRYYYCWCWNRNLDQYCQCIVSVQVPVLLPVLVQLVLLWTLPRLTVVSKSRITSAVILAGTVTLVLVLVLEPQVPAEGLLLCSNPSHGTLVANRRRLLPCCRCSERREMAIACSARCLPLLFAARPSCCDRDNSPDHTAIAELPLS
jgi:hypothetical protein